MAGAGRKTFVAGDVLTASDVNSYLMDQVVMRFASASARSTAISSPSQGMMSYLDDTNAIESYDGSSWVSISTNVPHAVAVLSASFAAVGSGLQPVQDAGNSGTTSTITFPSGRFSVAPIVTYAPGATPTNAYPGMTIQSVSASSVTFFVTNLGSASGSPGFGGNLTDWRINVFAAQYSTGSASG